MAMTNAPAESQSSPRLCDIRHVAAEIHGESKGSVEVRLEKPGTGNLKTKSLVRLVRNSEQLTVSILFPSNWPDPCCSTRERVFVLRVLAAVHLASTASKCGKCLGT